MTFPGRGGGASTSVRPRYPAVDVLRGLALLSMATAHLVHYRLESTAIGRFLHAGVWVDGAFFFVALSGLVVGLVHRRLVDRSGLRPSVVKLARRAAFLYVVHMVLVSFTVVAAWLDADNLISRAPPWPGPDGVLSVFGRVLLLQVEPEDNGVLPIYVVFLLLAIPAVALLRRGRWQTVIAGSLAIYGVGWAIGGVSFVPDEFSVTAWQALFMGGLLVGWTWEHERQRLRPEWRRVIVAGCSVVAAGFLLMALGAPGIGLRLFGDLLAKMAGGPLAFVYAATVMVVGYVLVVRALEWRLPAALLAPLRVLGSKGLPGYVALQVCAVVIDLFPGLPRNDLLILAVVVVCGVTEYVAVRWQTWRHPSRPSRPAEAGVAAAADLAGREPAAADLAGREPAAADLAGREPAAADLAGREPAAADLAGREPAAASADRPFLDVSDVDDERVGWSDRVPVSVPDQQP